MLHIITSTGGALHTNVNIDDLKILNDLEPPKDTGVVIFFAISGCDTHFKSELRQNGWR